MRIAIIGAGVAGFACASRLSRCGIKVSLYDKGRRPGGRLASVRIDDMAWDIGAQSFDARSPAFKKEVIEWNKKEWIAQWSDGPQGSWTGMPSMASLLDHLGASHDVRFGTLVQGLERSASGWHVVGPDFHEGPYGALVVAVPAEQAAPLLSLHDLAMAQAAATIRSAPCWTVMVCFEQPVGRANVVDGPGAIIAAVRSGSKPGRTHQECWVVQASSDWSRRHLEASREEVAARLLREFADLCGGTVPPPRFAKAHRWRYARPTGAPGAYLWNDDLRLGACGDWCLGSTVEDAWLSGNGLGGHVASTFPASGGAALP